MPSFMNGGIGMTSMPHHAAGQHATGHGMGPMPPIGSNPMHQFMTGATAGHEASGTDYWTGKMNVPVTGLGNGLEGSMDHKSMVCCNNVLQDSMSLKHTLSQYLIEMFELFLSNMIAFLSMSRHPGIRRQTRQDSTTRDGIITSSKLFRRANCCCVCVFLPPF